MKKTVIEWCTTVPDHQTIEDQTVIKIAMKQVAIDQCHTESEVSVKKTG
jgi:hypothetical protein